MLNQHHHKLKKLQNLMRDNHGKTNLVLEILSERKDNLESSLVKKKKREAHQCGKK
jgi:hypothetical protein